MNESALWSRNIRRPFKLIYTLYLTIPTIGIHVCGNFELGQPTDKQIEALAMLLGTVCYEYQLPIDGDHVVGHRDLMATACPGENLYNILQTVRGKAIWYQQN